jgi:molybdopterin-containing oxidoreductase family iron-sulfur binding subunit
MDRRDFFRLAGFGAVGVAGAQFLTKAAGDGLPTFDPAGEALTAKRWAMVIDVKTLLEKEDMDVLIRACHQTHNVPEIPNEAEAVKWIWTEPYEETFPAQAHEYAESWLQHKDLLVLCNHCDNPPCVRVCPTQATWKRESDGIVMMDWHRCIGCRYCIAACPYGSRSFNWRDPKPHIDSIDPSYPHRTRGVVEKCSFCEERLRVGKLPACVEACQHGALVFGDLADENSEVRQLLRTRHALRRKPSLGTKPEVFYLVDGPAEAAAPETTEVPAPDEA